MMKINCSVLLALTSVVVLLTGGCPAKSKSPQSWDSIDLKNDLIELQVVPEIGGRVIQYKLGEYGFFWVNEQLAGMEPPASGVGPNGEWLNYGGDKLWPAPQGWDNDQQWPGPPDPVLDGGPYTAELLRENNQPVAVRLTSRKDKRSGIQFSRVVKIFDDTTRVSVDATMKNIDTKPRRWGIWAVTQFDVSNRHGAGYNKNYWTFCPLNPNSIFHKGYRVIYGMVNNMSFKPDYQKGPPNAMMRVHYEYQVGKIGIDSSAGWIATLDATDGYVFVHRFTYEPDKAYPDDCSVEFWTNGLGEFVAWGRINKMPENPKDNPYVLESEILSPYATLEPGESYTFHYDWYAAKLPPNSPVIDCSSIGVTCKPLSARLRDGNLILDGQYGVFYKANCRLVLLDGNGNEIKEVSMQVPVTPLQPLILSQMPKFTEDTDVPENAHKLAICLYDTKGKTLGELARTQIQRD